MCYYKSQVANYEQLAEHYNASFEAITDEIDFYRAKFEEKLLKDDVLKSIGSGDSDLLGAQLIKYSQKDLAPADLTKSELTELRWYQRFLSAYGSDTTFHRYYENGFDLFPTHIITSGEPDKFKLFKWGMVPGFTQTADEAIDNGRKWLNCRSEDMWETKPFRDAVKNSQRCLIPITGFFEWHTLDEDRTNKDKIKIPYHVTFSDRKIRSIGGIYTRWKNPSNGEFYYSYSILTCPANPILDYVHNSAKRMPVFIDQVNEKEWLNRDLKKDDVDALCKTSLDPTMVAYTISKYLTSKNTNLNVPVVLSPFNYNQAIQEAYQYLQKGEKKKALEAFKNSVNFDKATEEHLKLAASENIKPELTLLS